MTLRPVHNDDIPAVIKLIGDLYADYGFAICLEDAEADLTAIPDHEPYDEYFFEKTLEN